MPIAATAASTRSTRRNVARLKTAWTFSDGAQYGHEGAPLVIGDTMYTVSPFPNRAYALDLTKPGAPTKWEFDPNPAPMAIGKACCDAVLRGWAIGDGKLIYNLLDAHTVAVDLKTGKEVWRTTMADVSQGRDDDDVGVRRGRQGLCRQFGRRDGRIGLDRRARHPHRQAIVARLFDRIGQGCVDRPALQAALSAISGQGPGPEDLARWRGAAGHRRGLGFHQL